MECKGFYANRVEMISSIYDYYVKFDAIKPILTPEAQVTGEELIGTCEIIMSPEFAKTFYQVLGDQIASHDKMVESAKAQKAESIEEIKQTEGAGNV